MAELQLKSYKTFFTYFTETRIAMFNIEQA